MAIELTTPEGPVVGQLELEPPTKAQLCAPAAVWLTHLAVIDTKKTLAACQTELSAERQRNEALVTRANTAETTLAILREKVETAKGTSLKVRLVEFILLVLLHYLGEAATAGELAKSLTLCLVCILLVILVIMIERGASE